VNDDVEKSAQHKDQEAPEDNKEEIKPIFLKLNLLINALTKSFGIYVKYLVGLCGLI